MRWRIAWQNKKSDQNSEIPDGNSEWNYKLTYRKSADRNGNGTGYSRQGNPDPDEQKQRQEQWMNQ